jgi:hypothetical protein
MLHPTIVEVVACNHGQHCIVKAHLPNGLRQSTWLITVGR